MFNEVTGRSNLLNLINKFIKFKQKESQPCRYLILISIEL